MQRLIAWTVVWLVCVGLLAAGAEPRVAVTGSWPREDISLTIYGPSVTLVQERRSLGLNQGVNEFRMSWAGVTVDRSSVGLNSPDLTIRDAVWLDSDPNTVIWRLDARRAGAYPVSVFYHVAGLSWEADHTLTVDDSEQRLALRSWAAIANRSGESYQDAEVRLALGDIQLLPGPWGPAGPPGPRPAVGADRAMARAEAGVAEFYREGSADYTFYTLARRESLESGEIRRVELANRSGIPVRKVFVHDEREHGSAVALQYWFENQREHELGPLPPGIARVYRQDGQGRLTLLGEDRLAHTAMGEMAKVHLGAARNLLVEVVQTAYQRADETFDRETGRLASFVERAEWTITIRNRREESSEVILRQYLPSPDAEVLDSTPQAKRPRADQLEWELKVGAGETQRVVFRTSRKVYQR